MVENSLSNIYRNDKTWEDVRSDLRAWRFLLVKWTMKPLKFSLGHWVRRLVRLWVSRVIASSLV